ncbi:hypothetical protein DFH09DRAFT_1317047 [Mycena vulgaris]|nr:hypothetical protein DFH09DRAFT_1317047 [Mycena vulgaris]
MLALQQRTYAHCKKPASALMRREGVTIDAHLPPSVTLFLPRSPECQDRASCLTTCALRDACPCARFKHAQLQRAGVSASASMGCTGEGVTHQLLMLRPPHGELPLLPAIQPSRPSLSLRSSSAMSRSSVHAKLPRRVYIHVWAAETPPSSPRSLALILFLLPPPAPAPPPPVFPRPPLPGPHILSFALTRSFPFSYSSLLASSDSVLQQGRKTASALSSPLSSFGNPPLLHTAPGLASSSRMLLPSSIPSTEVSRQHPPVRWRPRTLFAFSRLLRLPPPPIPSILEGEVGTRALRIASLLQGVHAHAHAHARELNPSKEPGPGPRGRQVEVCSMERPPARSLLVSPPSSQEPRHSLRSSSAAAPKSQRAPPLLGPALRCASRFSLSADNRARSCRVVALAAWKGGARRGLVRSSEVELCMNGDDVAPSIRVHHPIASTLIQHRVGIILAGGGNAGPPRARKRSSRSRLLSAGRGYTQRRCQNA